MIHFLRMYVAFHTVSTLWATMGAFSSVFAAAANTDKARLDTTRAIARGADYVRTRQHPDGHWEGDGCELGATALAVYTLLHAGATVNEPAVSSGLAVLLRASMASNPATFRTYEVALTAMALGAVIDRQHAGGKPERSCANVQACYRMLREAATWLVAAQHVCRAENRFRRLPTRSGSKTKPPLVETSSGTYDLSAFRSAEGGAWGYRFNDSNYVDNSNTQFALLGLWAASRAHQQLGETNVLVPRQTWEKALARLLAVQATAGEWNYGTSGLGPCGFQETMTPAGITGIAICVSSLAERATREKIRGITEVRRALARLEHYTYPPPATLRFGPAGLKPAVRHGYFLYSLERACMFCGLHRLGTHDWYAEGAAELLKNQNADGSWSAGAWYSGRNLRARAPHFRDNTIETCFALLFLTRAVPALPADSVSPGEGGP